MSLHFPKALLLVLLLAAAGETRNPESVLQTNLEYSSCEAGDDQYCCWDKKCIGSGDHADKSIKCDQKTHYCTTNSTTGYPICVKDEDGGVWTLCQIYGTKSVWYTYGCSYYSDGSVLDCDAWFGPLFYAVISLSVILLVAGIVLRVMRIRRMMNR